MKINATAVKMLIAAVQVEGVTDASLSIQVNKITTTTKDDGGWETILSGVTNWTMTGTINIDTSATNGMPELFAALVNGAESQVEFGIPGAGNGKFRGSGIVQGLELNAPLEDVYSSSFTINGSGPLAFVTVV